MSNGIEDVSINLSHEAIDLENDEQGPNPSITDEEDDAEVIWSKFVANPNPHHKHFTQDELRDASIKHLTQEQKRHFNLESKLNKKGSLFGPMRDEDRINYPEIEVRLVDESFDEEQGFDSMEDEDSVTPEHQVVSVQDDVTKGDEDESNIDLIIPESEMTSQIPNTNVSVRGSDVADDFAVLSVFDGVSTVPLDSTQKTSAFEEGKEHIDLIIEEDSIFKINDWFQLEENPDYFGKRKHFLRIVNTLNYDEKIVEVSNFQLLKSLVDLYEAKYNRNAHNYLWKDIWGNTLDLQKSLGENGLMDRSMIIDELGIDHFPTILLYFKDGFENDPLMRLDISKVRRDDIDRLHFCRNY